nr:MAG TPA: hypothetical protein [Caudoviricetes sp.]
MFVRRNDYSAVPDALHRNRLCRPDRHFLCCRQHRLPRERAVVRALLFNAVLRQRLVSLHGERQKVNAVRIIRKLSRKIVQTTDGIGALPHHEPGIFGELAADLVSLADTGDIVLGNNAVFRHLIRVAERADLGKAHRHADDIAVVIQPVDNGVAAANNGVRVGVANVFRLEHDPCIPAVFHVSPLRDVRNSRRSDDVYPVPVVRHRLAHAALRRGRGADADRGVVVPVRRGKALTHRVKAVGGKRAVSGGISRRVCSEILLVQPLVELGCGTGGGAWGVSQHGGVFCHALKICHAVKPSSQVVVFNGVEIRYVGFVLAHFPVELFGNEPLTAGVGVRLARLADRRERPVANLAFSLDRVVVESLFPDEINSERKNRYFRCVQFVAETSGFIKIHRDFRSRRNALPDRYNARRAVVGDRKRVILRVSVSILGDDPGRYDVIPCQAGIDCGSSGGGFLCGVNAVRKLRRRILRKPHDHFRRSVEQRDSLAHIRKHTIVEDREAVAHIPNQRDIVLYVGHGLRFDCFPCGSHGTASRQFDLSSKPSERFVVAFDSAKPRLAGVLDNCIQILIGAENQFNGGVAHLGLGDFQKFLVQKCDLLVGELPIRCCSLPAVNQRLLQSGDCLLRHIGSFGHSSRQSLELLGFGKLHRSPRAGESQQHNDELRNDLKNGFDKNLLHVKVTPLSLNV